MTLSYYRAIQSVFRREGALFNKSGVKLYISGFLWYDEHRANDSRYR